MHLLSFAGSCLATLYIMAFTSGFQHAGSDIGHSVQLQANGEVRNIRLYNLPGNDMLENKGDLWKIKFFPTFTSQNALQLEKYGEWL